MLFTRYFKGHRSRISMRSVFACTNGGSGTRRCFSEQKNARKSSKKKRKKKLSSHFFFFTFLSLYCRFCCLKRVVTSAFRALPFVNWEGRRCVSFLLGCYETTRERNSFTTEIHMGRHDALTHLSFHFSFLSQNRHEP